MSKKITITETKNRIKQRYGDKVTIVDSSFISYNKKAYFIHSEYGNFWATPKHVAQGILSKEIYSKTRATPLKDVKDKVFAIHGDIVTIREETYINCTTKATFNDKIYGDWMAKPNDVIKGHGNPLRADFNRRIPIEEVEKRLFEKHEGNIVIDKDTYIKVSEKADFIDKDYGRFTAKVWEVLDGSGHKKRQANLISISIEELKTRLFSKHGNLITIDESTYKNYCTHKAKFTDKEHGDWWSIPKSVVEGLGHPKRGKFSTMLKQRLPIEKVLDSIFKSHGNSVHIDESTYVNCSTKARFIHEKYGEWWAVPSFVLKGGSHPFNTPDKIKETCLKKYGVSSPMKNLEISRRSASSQTTATIKNHWKTNKQLTCQGSYESAVVDYLNLNQINFEWQPKVFQMPNGKTYRPDLYLVDQDVWVEIKGYFRKDALEKWEWFGSEHPTAELWDKKKLKEMGIL